MNPTETPNLEALETGLRVGPYTVAPVTLKTIILLERIGSPLVGQSRENAPLPFTDTVEALWVLQNADRPDITRVLADNEGFARAVNRLAQEIDLSAVPRIIADLSAAFAAVNKTFAEAGVTGDDGQKKDPTGPSA